MKLATRQTSTQVIGETEKPRTFSINANDVAFGVLSSGLYNDKIRAIIRELSCNAWDAHVMAGKKDAPFEVHLPTDFEPWFSIKDYGVGLSHDDVMQLYCTYFASNKNNSNEVVGAMGLGSKSPFCYTQAQGDSNGFTVTSRFKGVKRIYSAYVDGGAPTIVCLSEEKTDDSNGLEIQFAVNTDDVWEFENKARKALEFFDPMPVINIEGFEPEMQDYVLKTPLWGLRKEGDGVRAIQGMVQYMVGSIDSSRMTPEQQKIAELPLDIFFPIGELSVAANREMLSNDTRTINNVLAMYTKVYQSLADEIRKGLNTCRTAWEARLRLSALLADDTLGEIIREAYDEDKFYGKYDHFTISKEPPSLNELDYTALQVVRYAHYSSRKYAGKEYLFRKRTPDYMAGRQLAFEQIKTTPADAPKIREGFLRTFPVEATVVFVFNDVDNRHANKYMQAYVQGGRDDQGKPLCEYAYLFSPVPGKGAKKVQKEFKKALVALGDPKYILLSAIKEKFQSVVDAMKPVPKPKIKGVLEIDGSGHSYRGGAHSGWLKNTWKTVPYDQLPKGQKLYVLVEDKEVKSVNFHNARTFCSLIDNVKGSRLFPMIGASTRIFGLTQKQLDKMDASDLREWTDALEYVFTLAPVVIPDSKVMEISIYVKPFDCPHETALKAMLKDEARFGKSPLFEYAQHYLAVKGKQRDAQAKATADLVEKLVELRKYKRGEVLDFQSEWKRIVQKRYPMLALCNSYSYGGIAVPYADSVLDYVHLMDSREENQ